MLQNRDAELTILGMAMLDQRAADKLCSLPSDVFTTLDTKSLFLGIQRVVMEHRGKPDLLTVKSACAELELDPGEALLIAARGAITAANYEQYESILMGLYRRRVIYASCADLINHIGDLGEDVDILAGNVVKAIQETCRQEASVTAYESLTRLIEHVSSGEVDGINTGIAGLDEILGGLRGKRLYYLGARPGVGKTALAIWIAEFIAMKSGPVLVVSLEMSDEQIMTRIMAKEAMIDSQKIDNCKLNGNEWEKFSEATALVSHLPIRFTEYARTPLQIRQEAKAMIQHEGLKLIVVDYLQLMHSDTPAKSRQEEIAQISRELKLITMDLDVPVLALTQFNRESEGHAGMKKRKPSMAEARDSGAIEQDANVFMTLYTPEEPKAGTMQHELWEGCQKLEMEFQILSVDKNRHGKTGPICLAFDKAHMDFTTMKVQGETE